MKQIISTDVIVIILLPNLVLSLESGAIKSMHENLYLPSSAIPAPLEVLWTKGMFLVRYVSNETVIDNGEGELIE